MGSRNQSLSQVDGDTRLHHKADETVSQPHQSLASKMGFFDLAGLAEDVESHALAMQQCCRKLLNELEQFQAYLKHQKKENSVELRTFKGGLQAEMKSLDKLVIADPLNPKTSHALRSSNFSFYAVVWDTAKTCSSITAFGKRFYWVPTQNSLSMDFKASNTGTAHRTNSAVVDIVAQDGLEWIKVSSITEKRIIWDLAKAGWVGASSDEDNEDGNLPLDDDDENPQGLLKQAEALKKAAVAARVRYRHPTIRLVLPRIKAVPDSKEVGHVLQKIRDLGVIVQTSDQLAPRTSSIHQVLGCMAADRFESFSEWLNIDCTILLAFASDLSHGRVEPEDWHNQAISRQIEMESEDQLLPNSLWPACGAKKLVCTRAAAIRMQEIVAIIGTETEKRRATLMLNFDNNASLTREQRVQIFQALSDYPIPKDWYLPIEITDVELETLKSDLPPIAEKVAETLTAINKSVFLFGWATGTTTISSNRAVSKEIEATIEENRVDEETKGPDIWLCPTSRSLVGKEKQRRGFHDNGLVP